MAKTFLVAGGGGFIGSNICHRLVADGQKVIVYDNFLTGRHENLASIKDQLTIIEGDIKDPVAFAEAVQGVDNVILLAALPSVARSVEDPVASNDTNVNGLLNVLEQSRKAKVDRVVFSSSSSVYGNTAELPKHEGMTPSPLSPYAAQKLMGEHYMRLYFELYGLKTYCLRYFNVFGPRQNPKSDYAAVIPLFINWRLNGIAPSIEGDGGQTRDFTYVDDVVAANLACCEAPESAAGRSYNAAQGGRVSILDLAIKIGEIVGNTETPVHVPVRKGDVRDSQAASELAKEYLNWEAEVSFEEGLEKTINWYKENAS